LFPKAKAGIIAGLIAAAFLLPGVSGGEGFTLTQTISTSLMYESNANLAPTTGKPESDYSLRITPKIELMKETGTSSIKGFYSPTGDVYFKHHDLDSLSHYAGLDMSKELSEKTSIKLDELFGFSKDIHTVSTSGIQVSRGDVVSNTVAAGVTRKLSARSSVGLTLTDALTQIKSSTGTTNGRADSAGLSGSFAATETTSLTAGYTFSKFFFNSPTEKGSTESHSVLLGVVQSFPYSLDVTLSGGAAYSPSLKDQYTALYGAGIKKSFQRSSVTFDYSRSLVNTGLLSKFLNVTDTYTLKWAYKVTESIDAGAAGFYSTNKTRPVAEVDITSWGYSVDGSWRPYSWMTVGGSYTHFMQTSKGTIGADFKRDDVSVNVTFTAYEGRF
jgi:hypothetical protein